jgi:hypothetical protein
MICTHQELAEAIARLARRSPEQLATFIATLAVEGGLVGERVELFVVADDVAETVAAVQVQLQSLRLIAAADRRNRFGENVSKRLDYLLDAIESVVLPAIPQQAFDLLVKLFECDGAAMESCGDFDDAVSSAYGRAARLVEVAARSLPAEKVRKTLDQLVAGDGYGTRRAIANALSDMSPPGLMHEQQRRQP